MVFTIHRYIFRELLRIFVLAAVALTLILSLGSMLRPIQEYGVGPGQIIHLLGYFLPITLTFVLPMAALFAAALTYGRFASDNEFDACRASGISLITLIYPGLCLAIAVAITTLVLSFHVVPAFVHRAEKAIKANAKQILFRNIDRKGYYTLPDSNFRIYADQAITDEDTLNGVIVSKSEGANITKLVTAKTAKIKFADIGKAVNKVTVVAQEAYQIDDRGQAYSKNLPVSGRFESLLADSVKFQKIEQLKQIRIDMMNFRPIRQLALKARAQLAAELLAEQITQKITGDGDGYYQLFAEDRIVLFSAGRCTAKNPSTEKKDKNKAPVIELSATVRLSEVNKVRRKLICDWESVDGIIQFDDNEPGSSLEMVLYSPTWQQPDGPRNLARRHVIRNISLPEDIEQKLAQEDILEKLLNVKSLLAMPNPGLINLQNQLKAEIEYTINEISAEIHSRLVLGLGCITLILIAIVLGIIYRGGHLLSAFGTSAIPAGALIIFILAGKDLTKNPSVPATVGIAVMWSGLVLLSGLTIIMYRKLLKT
ncbi:MAG: LptF/LptG family permease [Planctomycetota bacterium]|jgi:lipopolysaccharide export LptBFGC system permease protein LptF